MLAPADHSSVETAVFWLAGRSAIDEPGYGASCDPSGKEPHEPWR